MKKTIIALAVSIASTAAFAAEPVYAKTTPNPVVAPEPSNEKQKVCIKDDKTGKETCKMMKVHKKLEGTPAPKK